MGGVLVLGLLVGMRHALEADHVAAVAALTARSRNLGGALRLGAAWGLGHTLTLFAAAPWCSRSTASCPSTSRTSSSLSSASCWCCWGRPAAAPDRGARSLPHAPPRRRHDPLSCSQPRRRGRSRRIAPRPCARARPAVRALAVGLMHGLAGSAALILLTAGQIDSLLWALAYLALFGIGSLIGMAALSVVIAIPLQRLARSLSWAHNALGATVGLGTIGLGAWIAYRIGIVEGLTLG